MPQLPRSDGGTSADNLARHARRNLAVESRSTMAPGPSNVDPARLMTVQTSEDPPIPSKPLTLDCCFRNFCYHKQSYRKMKEVIKLLITNLFCPFCCTWFTQNNRRSCQGRGFTVSTRYIVEQQINKNPETSHDELFICSNKRACNTYKCSEANIYPESQKRLQGNQPHFPKTQKEKNSMSG